MDLLRFKISRRCFCIVLLLVVSSTGQLFAEKPLDEVRVWMQSARWNAARVFKPTDPQRDGVSIVTIAGAKRSQLRHWMENCPPPSLEEMRGTWRGLNRGIGPALMGFSQFSKQMCVNCQGAHGDNITIKQVGPCDWSNGSNWRAIKKQQKIDRHGFYKICHDQQAAILDYGAAENPPCDPAKFLVDKIVKLDDRYLLGRAMVRVGFAKVTVAYFVLERAG